jgi:hypothetical protein
MAIIWRRIQTHQCPGGAATTTSLPVRFPFAPEVPAEAGEVCMSSAITTTDHDKIRKWAESNNGHPACVKGTGEGDDPGMLRIDFDEAEEGLARISWNKWFEWFDRNELALLHSEDSRFNMLVSRTEH